MVDFDVVFLHAPKTFNSLRKKPKSRVEKHLIEIGAEPNFCFIPMGVFSLASNIHNRGYKVKIVNLGIKQQFENNFEITKYIKSLHSKIFAIDLQWFVHSASALQVSKICKNAHPSSFVVLGGITASWFSREILMKNPFVDAILLGEADETFPQLVDSWLRGGALTEIGGLKYREKRRIRVNPIKKTLSSIDHLDFTNLSLLEDEKKYLRNDIMRCGNSKQTLFWLPISRGCPYHCLHCGGSSESYKMFSKREKPVMRDPHKVSEDIERLTEYGVEYINLSHDPRIGGDEYSETFMEEIKKRGVDASVYIETFTLPNRDYIKRISKIFNKVVFALSPESAYEEVRKYVGRSFSNDQLFKTLSITKEYGIESQLYFTIGLPKERRNKDTLNYYKHFIDKTSSLGGVVIPSSVYTIDPNCMMAVDRKKHGIHLLLKNFKDYQRICPSLNVKDWIGHETKLLSKNDIYYLSTQIQSLAMTTLQRKIKHE